MVTLEHNQMNEINRRNIGIDLLKMISMLLVICTHIYMQGGVLYAEKYGTVGYYVSSFAYSMSLCAVDCFIIIHGYCACKSKFKLSRIIERWLLVLFWSVVISCIIMVIQPEMRSVTEAISMFFPVLRGRYWFFNAFLVLFMFEPILNHVIETLSERKYRLMLVAAGMIFCLIPVASLGNDVLKISGGAEFCWFFVLYLVGGYLRKYVTNGKVEYKNYLNIVLFFGLAFLNLAYKAVIENLTSFVLGRVLFGELLWTNTSPIMLGEAIFLFLFFSRLKIEDISFTSKIVKLVTPLVFAVYIIHAHPCVFWNDVVVKAFVPLAEFNPIFTLLMVLAISIIVFLACIILDFIRATLFRILKVRLLCDKIGNLLSLYTYKMLRIK